MLGKATSIEKWTIEQFNTATCPCDGTDLIWTVDDDGDNVASCCYIEYHATLSPDNDYNVVIMMDFELKRCVGCDAVKPTGNGLCKRCKRYRTDMDGKLMRERTVRNFYRYKTVHLLEENYQCF